MYKRVDTEEAINKTKNLFNKNHPPIFGKYLTKKQRKHRIWLMLIILLIYGIVQAYALKYIKQSAILSLSVLPLALAGWLLGIWAPVFSGIVVNIYLMYLLYIFHFDIVFPGPYLIIIYILTGVGIGWFSELTYKAKVTEAALLVAKNEAVEANKAKSEFLASISHEIRTPMNSILGFTQLLYDEIEDKRHKEKLEIILKASNSLLELINDLLDISKIEAGKIEIHNVEFTFSQLFYPIENIFSIKATEKKLGFLLILDPALPAIVYGDERRIQQIVLNLASNALKFTKQGRVTIHCRYENGHAIIKISDTGIGIPEDKQTLVFDAFKQLDPTLTREYGGTGLGLTISKRLIDEMNGKISLESKPDQGTIITVQIPLEDISIKYTPNKPTIVIPENTDCGREITRLALELKKHDFLYTLLIVTNDESSRQFFSQTLNGLELELDYADTANEAIVKLQSRLTEDKKYNLLLLDAQLAGKSAIEVLEFIRGQSAFDEIYCIVLTANMDKVEQAEFLTSGCHNYLAKPADKDLLLLQIFKLVLEKAKIIENNKTISMQIPQLALKRLKRIIIKLKHNYELFDVDELVKIRKELSTILPEPYLQQISDKLDTAIINYDDGILNEVIQQLDTII